MDLETTFPAKEEDVKMLGDAPVEEGAHENSSFRIECGSTATQKPWRSANVVEEDYQGRSLAT